MSKGERLAILEEVVEELVNEVRRSKTYNLTGKSVLENYTLPYLHKVIGLTWECCSCGRIRFYAIEKPGLERLPVETGYFERKVSVCADCEKDFEETRKAANDNRP